MADIANYKDKLLQLYGLTNDRVIAGAGFGDVEWLEVTNTSGLKPENLATLGATFDKDIHNLCDTQNIQFNAVTESEFDETYEYNLGTEIMEVSIDLKSYGGSESVLFISGTFISNYNSTASTTNRSRVLMTVEFNSTTLWSGEISVIPNQENSYFLTSFSDKYAHAPVGAGDNIFLVTNKGAFLSPGNSDYLVAGKNGHETNNYKIGFEYVSSCDGTRGALYHVSVYGLTLKR